MSGVAKRARSKDTDFCWRQVARRSRHCPSRNRVCERRLLHAGVRWRLSLFIHSRFDLLVVSGAVRSAEGCGLISKREVLVSDFARKFIDLVRVSKANEALQFDDPVKCGN